MRIKPSEQTIKKLFALSGNCCAFPGCEQKIIDREGNLIGEICHIEAANPDGERYNPAQSDQERASFENLILLCANHHKVTNNVAIYTVATLKAMKKNHETQFVTHPYSINKTEWTNVLSSIDEKLERIVENTTNGSPSQHKDPYNLTPRFSTLIPGYENPTGPGLIPGAPLLALEGMNTGDRTITLSSWGFGLPDGTNLTQDPRFFPVKFPYKLAPGESVTVWFEYKELFQGLKQKGYSGQIIFNGFFKDQIGHIWSIKSEPCDINEWLKLE